MTTYHHTFGRKGIHPPENKHTAGMPITALPLPRRVELSLSQSLGRPARAIVKAGDHVCRFDLVGEATGPVSANLHTPISGTVKSVGRIETADGHGADGIVIEADDIDHAADLQAMCDESPVRSGHALDSLTPEEIIDIVRRAGIVGLGGATFPTATKLTPPPGSPQCEFLLINAAECEPYLTCDDAIMRAMAEEIATGIELLLKALGSNVHCLVGIEENKPQAIKALEEACRPRKKIRIIPLRTRYPQGAEKMLTKALTGREIASGALPISQGVIIQNVATALAVYHSIVWGKPLVERVMTIYNPGERLHGNVIVPIGTPIKSLLPESSLEGKQKIINGGPMMGRAIAGIQGATTKGMSGLLLLTPEEAPVADSTPCVRCGRCVEVCPIGLEPYLLARLSELGRKEELEQRHVLDCMECGCCSYNCMARRRLVDWIRTGKALARRK